MGEGRESGERKDGLARTCTSLGCWSKVDQKLVAGGDPQTPPCYTTAVADLLLLGETPRPPLTDTLIARYNCSLRRRSPRVLYYCSWGFYRGFGELRVFCLGARDNRQQDKVCLVGGWGLYD
jgi:hypothetical protein